MAIYNIFQYGAVGNGTNNDAIAIQAIAKCNSSGAGRGLVLERFRVSDAHGSRLWMGQA